MRKSVIWMTAFLMAFAFSHVVFAQGPLRIENYRTHVLNGPDTEGYVEFTVTVTARNLSEYGQWFFISVQAVDVNGSPMQIINLRGRIGGRESGTLEGLGFMPLEAYLSIAGWERY
jgi:hypothetical protein